MRIVSWTARLLLASALALGALNASVITFSEVPATNSNCCYLTNEYAALGVTFMNNGGSVWGGNSAGNPGNWGVDGTNTPPFLGFNGIGPFGGYSASLVFAAPIANFSLDVSPTNGSAPTDQFTLTAYDSASAVLFSQTVTLSTINVWQSILAGSSGISRVDIMGTGSGFHPFGIDNLQWNASVGQVPEPSTFILAAIGLLAAGSRRLFSRPAR